MKTIHLHQKFISIFLVCLMLILGIHVAGTQGDSFFTFFKGGIQTEVIGKVQKEIKPAGYILERYNDFWKEGEDRTKQQKNRGNLREQCIIGLNNNLHTNLFLAFQKADTRIWQPSQLTDAFTILYIHQQDGLKRRSPHFL